MQLVGSRARSGLRNITYHKRATVPTSPRSPRICLVLRDIGKMGLAIVFFFCSMFVARCDGCVGVCVTDGSVVAVRLYATRGFFDDCVLLLLDE